MTTDLLPFKTSQTAPGFEAVYPVGDLLGWALAILNRALWLRRSWRDSSRMRIER